VVEHHRLIRILSKFTIQWLYIRKALKIFTVSLKSSASIVLVYHKKKKSYSSILSFNKVSKSQFYDFYVLDQILNSQKKIGFGFIFL